MRKRNRGAVLVALLVAAGGCAQNLVVGVDPGDAGGTTGSGFGGATGSSTGSSTGSATGSSTGGAVASGTGGGSTPYTSRLTGPQPGMVGVTSPKGVTYWIDSTEVPQAAYAQFLASNPKPDPKSTTCAWKTTFEPGMEPGDENEKEGDPTECHMDNTYFDPASHGDDPVVCVDWCDAQAYCLWAGKRLCGHIGGGPSVVSSTEDDFSDPNGGQWYGACSNGGTTPFPYGPTYVEGECNDGTTVAPVGQTPGCHGTTAPFSGIFDMSGNVAEWEDACGPSPSNPGGGVRSDRCEVRGGSYNPNGIPSGIPGSMAGWVCGDGIEIDGKLYSNNVGDSRDFERPKTGFRCCVD